MRLSATRSSVTSRTVAVAAAGGDITVNYAVLGGGGGGAGEDYYDAGAGGGGELLESTFAPVSGTTYTITVGSGGAYGSNTNGSTGGDSSIVGGAVSITADAGFGGVGLVGGNSGSGNSGGAAGAEFLWRRRRWR